MSRPSNTYRALVPMRCTAVIVALAVPAAQAASHRVAVPNIAASDSTPSRAAAASAGLANLEPDFSQRDIQFAQSALQAGLAIIARGSLAVQQSGSEAVRRFGERMLDEHGGSNAELLSLASKRGLTLSAQLAPAQHAMVQRMAEFRGEAFDRAYLTWTIETHRYRIAQHDEQARVGEDAVLKAWALRSIDMLRRHLAAAEANHAALVEQRR